MSDDVLLNKAATIERCVARAREEYTADPDTFASNFTRQDADMGHHIIRRESLGLPQSSRDVFAVLAHALWLEADTAEAMKRMVGFRNIAVHEYQTLLLPIMVNIIQFHLEDFLHFVRQTLTKDSMPSGT